VRFVRALIVTQPIDDDVSFMLTHASERATDASDVLRLHFNHHQDDDKGDANPYGTKGNNYTTNNGVFLPNLWANRSQSKQEN
jgi:hypothetical protein